MTVVIKTRKVNTYCYVCGRYIVGRQYEMIKPRGGSERYFCPSCIKEQIGGRKDERE